MSFHRNRSIQELLHSSSYTLVFAFATLCTTVTAKAENPWGRAVGEAIDLRSVTEDMRNRAERLFPGSSPAHYARLQDDYACRLRDAVKIGIPQCDLQQGLVTFDYIRGRLQHAISCDPYIAGDRGLRNYMRSVDRLFGNLTKDLSKSHYWVAAPIVNLPPQYQPLFPNFPQQPPDDLTPWSGPLDSYHENSGFSANGDYSDSMEYPRHHAAKPNVPSLETPIVGIPSVTNTRPSQPRIPSQVFPTPSPALPYGESIQPELKLPSPNRPAVVDPQFWDGAVEL